MSASVACDAAYIKALRVSIPHRDPHLSRPRRPCTIGHPLGRAGRRRAAVGPASAQRPRYPEAIVSRREIRSAIGGWVEKSRETSWARNGLAIIMWLALTICCWG